MSRLPPSSVAERTEFVIRRVGAQGDGVTDGGVYVPLTLPGERVEARYSGDRGELERVLAASAERVSPLCPHFGACGGCALQHWSHQPYLAWKLEQVRATLGRERIETEILAPFAAPAGARRRLALHARKTGGRVALGFKARRSWDLVEISRCPIADPRLEAALPALARFAGPLFQHPKSAPTLHVTLTDTGLDVDVTGVEARSGGPTADARVRLAALAAEADVARATLGGEMLFQSRRPVVAFGRAKVALPAGGFLQAVAAAETAMADFVLAAVAGSRRVADLYCGGGAFTFRLAEQSSVTAFDASAPAVAALREALGSAPGLKSITAEARDLDRRPMLASEMKALDAAVFDPPRAGARVQAGELARSNLSRVVGVSCNPVSFARDARVLVDAGFRLARLLPVDQFVWSPHIEVVGVFER